MVQPSVWHLAGPGRKADEKAVSASKRLPDVLRSVRDSYGPHTPFVDVQVALEQQV